MAEYIERKALLSKLSFDNGHRIPEVDIDNFPVTVTISDIKKLIREIPAAHVAPVVHGQWIHDPASCHRVHFWFCSVCRGKAVRKSCYCPNCGAKMEEAR